MTPVYLDTSALVKLVVHEPESPALWHYLRERTRRASCSLARVELVRATRAHGTSVLSRSRRLLDHLELLHLDDALLDDAAEVAGPELRSLDAIHLAAARSLGEDLAALVTYDARMKAAAKGLGLPVASPA